MDKDLEAKVENYIAVAGLCDIIKKEICAGRPCRSCPFDYDDLCGKIKKLHYEISSYVNRIRK